MATYRVVGFGLKVADAERPWLAKCHAVDVDVEHADAGHARALAVLASKETVRWQSAPQVIDSPATALAPLASGNHRIYRVQWFAGGRCAVTSNVNHAIIGTFVMGEWDDSGKLPDDVRAYAMSIQPVEKTK